MKITAPKLYLYILAAYLIGVPAFSLLILLAVNIPQFLFIGLMALGESGFAAGSLFLGSFTASFIIPAILILTSRRLLLQTAKKHQIILSLCLSVVVLLYHLLNQAPEYALLHIYINIYTPVLLIVGCLVALFAGTATQQKPGQLAPFWPVFFIAIGFSIFSFGFSDEKEITNKSATIAEELDKKCAGNSTCDKVEIRTGTTSTEQRTLLIAALKKYKYKEIEADFIKGVDVLPEELAEQDQLEKITVDLPSTSSSLKPLMGLKQLNKLILFTHGCDFPMDALELQSLESLHISFNFSEQNAKSPGCMKVPSEISKLKNLKELRLSYSADRGTGQKGTWPFTHQITEIEFPTSMAELVHLERLSIVMDPNLGSSPNEAIYNPPQLKNLNLEYLAGPLPPHIEKAQNLTELWLKGVFAGKLRELPPEVGNLPALKILSITETPFTALIYQPGQYANLQELTIESEQLSQFPVDLFSTAHLKKLRLTKACLPPETIEAINNQKAAIKSLYVGGSACIPNQSFDF